MVTGILVPVGRMTPALPGVKAAVTVSHGVLSRSGEVPEDLIDNDLHGVSRFRGQQEQIQNGVCDKVRE